MKPIVVAVLVVAGLCASQARAAQPPDTEFYQSVQGRWTAPVSTNTYGGPSYASTQQSSMQSSTKVGTTSGTLSAGSRLSVALEQYLRQRGWELRWLIDEDYVLDVDFPVPATELIEGVTWVVHSYQSQGGMRGVVPRFARGNKVVVIEKMDVREPN